MSANNRIHVIGFAIVLGSLAYLASALWSALFIVTLPMDKAAIVDAIEIETGVDRFGDVQTEWHPIKFKNSIEELKYYHNANMMERNSYWIGGLVVVGGVIGLFAFYLIPKWRDKLEYQGDPPVPVMGSFILGVSVVLIIPFLLSWILPAPATWFPREIRAISELRQKEVLDQIQAVARQLDAEAEFNKL